MWVIFAPTMAAVLPLDWTSWWGITSLFSRWTTPPVARCSVADGLPGPPPLMANVWQPRVTWSIMTLALVGTRAAAGVDGAATRWTTVVVWWLLLMSSATSDI